MPVKKSYDAVIVGGGHMGITLGAYLQRAGMETAVFERRHEEGSAIYTSECTAPGFLHNLHAQYMEFLDWMPFYHDFGLERLGARTLYPVAQSGIAFSDGRPPIILYSVEKPEHLELSRQSIAVYSRHDAETFVEIRNKVRSLEPLMASRVISAGNFSSRQGAIFFVSFTYLTKSSMAASTAAESSAKGPVSDWVPPTYRVFAHTPGANIPVITARAKRIKIVNVSLYLAIFSLLFYRHVVGSNPIPVFLDGARGLAKIHPDHPSRCHLPFDGLMALSKVEGQHCLRSFLPAAYEKGAGHRA